MNIRIKTKLCPTLCFVIVATLHFLGIANKAHSQEQAVNYDRIKNEYQSILDRPYLLIPHKRNYLMPLVYNDNPNQEPYKDLLDDEDFKNRGPFNDYLEAEFQISFSFLTGRKVFGTKFDTFFAYTHKAFWQLYNEDWSRPFRETNYTPEYFARYVVDKDEAPDKVNLLAYDIGLVHQSNGQIQALSRSWNRVFARFVVLSGTTAFNATVWYRIPEAADKDDNPDIYRYLGYGQLEIRNRFERLETSLRLIPGTEKTGVELELTFPWKEGIRFYTKASYGYGLSLIDYDHDNRRFGMGISISNILDQSASISRK